MQKKLERQKLAVKKKLSKPNESKEFRSNIDALSDLDKRRRFDDKKRSRKLRIRIPS